MSEVPLYTHTPGAREFYLALPWVRTPPPPPLLAWSIERARIQGYLAHAKMPTLLRTPLGPYAWASGKVVGFYFCKGGAPVRHTTRVRTRNKKIAPSPGTNIGPQA